MVSVLDYVAYIVRVLHVVCKLDSNTAGREGCYDVRNLSSLLLKDSIEVASTISSGKEFHTGAMRLRKKLCLG